MLDAILNLLFPQSCVLCGIQVFERRWSAACPECWSKLEPIPRPFCLQCGMPAAAIETVCGACRRGDHAFDFARSLFLFNDPMRGIIHHLKYSARVSLAKPLGQLLRDCVTQAGFEAKIALPVPLHRSRARERGFNQAEIIAAAVSRSTGITVDKLSLARKVHTPMHRTGMDQKARELTIHNAFEVTRPRLIAGKAVVLVDDVLTSGATASQAARTLKKNGATRVNVFTLARAVMH